MSPLADKLLEADATDQEYWDLLGKERPDLIDLTRTSEVPLKVMGVKIQNRKSKSGKLIVRWGQGGDCIAILGIVALDSRLSREDVGELRQWIAELRDHLLNGGTVVTSTNEKSGPLLDAVQREIEGMGKKVDRTELGRIPIGHQEYVNVMLTVV